MKSQKLHSLKSSRSKPTQNDLFFIGRSYELMQLKSLESLKIASIVVVQGRRRIGKSRLIQEYSKDKTLYEFSGLIPDHKTTAQSQRDQFCIQFKNYFKFEIKNKNDWSHIFFDLGRAVTHTKCIIMLDEISWMGSLDPDFIGKLKIAWDLYFSKNNGLFLVFCGSISWWIEENILNNTAFFGRINLIINLQELSLSDSAKFLRKKKTNLSHNEIIKILSVTGGVPRYLELIDPTISAEDNIKRLCFQKNGALLSEYNRIFTDIFGSRSNTFEKIIKILLYKKLTLGEIVSKLNITKSTYLIGQLRLLKISGFIEEDATWDIKTGKISEFKTYRLKDNYLRFYLKYLKHNLHLIEKDIFKFQSLYQLPGLEVIFGFQCENLFINNSDKIFQVAGIEKSDVLFHGPYFQRKTARREGCQVDYLIQTRQKNIFMCEIKFKRDPIGFEVIKEMQSKYKAIVKPRNTTYRFILLSAGEVKASIYDTGYFDKIILFEDLLY